MFCKFYIYFSCPKMYERLCVCRVSLTLGCPMDLKLFPLDTQVNIQYILHCKYDLKEHISTNLKGQCHQIFKCIFGGLKDSTWTTAKNFEKPIFTLHMGPGSFFWIKWSKISCHYLFKNKKFRFHQNLWSDQ